MHERCLKTFAAITLSIIAATTIGSGASAADDQLYTARTTLIETGTLSERNDSNRLATLAEIATSGRVMGAAARVFADFGLDKTQILGSVTARAVKDTSILAIEVTWPNPQEAKLAADVIATEFKRAYAEIYTASARQTRAFLEAALETVLRGMKGANESLYQYKKTHKKRDVKLVQLETEARVATEDYLMLRRKLREATIDEQRLKNTCAMRTIDPAVVFPVRP